MPAIKQSSQVTDGKVVPPVTHRAILGDKSRVTCTVDGKPVHLPSDFAKRDWAKKVQQLKRTTKEKPHNG